MPASRKQELKSLVKFGKFLAVAMSVSLIWAILLLITGFLIRFKFGMLLNSMLGDIASDYQTQNAINSHGQNIAPTGKVADDYSLGSATKVIGSVIIASGLLIALFAILGIYSGLKHNKLLLILTVVILVIDAFLMLGLISFVISTESGFHTSAKGELTDMLKSEYTIETVDDDFVLAMNSIMFGFHCCGINGVDDFVNVTFYEIQTEQTKIKYYFKVAPACCGSHIFNSRNDKVSDQAYLRIKDCAINGQNAKADLKTQGCYDALFEHFQGLMAGILVVILLWSILCLVLTILTILEIKPVAQPRMSASKEAAAAAAAERRATEEAMDREEQALAVKKFVPYAKVSSFVHPDVNRIKSTEIW